jgi:hypothetical protein
MGSVVVHASCTQLPSQSLELLKAKAKNGHLLSEQVAVLQVLVTSTQFPSDTAFVALNVSLQEAPASAASDIAAQALREALGTSVPVPEVNTINSDSSVNVPKSVANSPASQLQEAARSGVEKTQQAWQSFDSRFGISQNFHKAQESARAQWQELSKLETQDRLKQDGRRVGEALQQFGRDASESLRRATASRGDDGSASYQ